MRLNAYGLAVVVSVMALSGAAKADDALRTLTGHTGYVTSVAVTPDGQTIVSAGGDLDNTIKVWSISGGPALRTLPVGTDAGHTSAVSSVAVTPDGQAIVSGSYDNTIKVWRLSDGQLLRTLTGHSEAVNGGIVLTPDGQTIVSGSYDKTIKVWSLSGGAALRTINWQEASSGVNSVTLTPDGQTVVSGSAAGVKLWRLSDGALLRTLTGAGYVSSVAVTPDGETVVSAGGPPDYAIKFWRLSDGQLLRTTTGQSNVNDIVVTPDCQTLVSAGGYMENTIKVWRISDGTLVRSLTGHTGSVYSVAVTPDGQTIVSGSNDKTVKVWGLPHSMYLPVLEAVPGSPVIISVKGNVQTAYSAAVTFTMDPSHLAMGTPFVVSHAFEGKQSAQISWDVRGDSVFVALSAAEPIALQDETLVSLQFSLDLQTPIGTVVPLSWVPLGASYNETRLQSLAVGSVTATGVYGDASGDGQLTALDASYILQYVVGTKTGINHSIADVTGNGWVSSFDAAWVLVKLLHPEKLFPCEGGDPLPGTKRARIPPRSLAFVPADDGWNLVVSQPDGIIGCDLTLLLQDGSHVAFSGDGAIEHAMDGQTALVGIARAQFTNPVLLHVSGTTGAPQIVTASLNEGQIPLLLPQPVAFTLSQNTPNPFNPSTTLRFALPEAGHVTLAVYDINGRLVRNLLVGGAAPAAQAFLPGQHEVVWDGRDNTGREVASGVYLARLTAPQGVVTRRMVLVR